jgi:hypothetical protein
MKISPKVRVLLYFMLAGIVPFACLGILIGDIKLAALAYAGFAGGMLIIAILIYVFNIKDIDIS